MNQPHDPAPASGPDELPPQVCQNPGGPRLADLLKALHRIPDPRAQGQVRHPLAEVLFIALCAVISDGDSFTDMELFARTQADWLHRYVPLVHGPPSHDTFRYVFSLIRPEALLALMREWLGDLSGLHLKIDGKVSRGAKDPESGRSRLHVLRAWVSEVGLSAGQIACEDKTNELSMLPAFLDSLELKGTLTSIDAMAGHPAIAQQIHEAGGDWLLALKANEKATMDTVAARFRHLSGQEDHLPEDVPASPTLHPPHVAALNWAEPCQIFTSQERNRGRFEQREVVVVAVDDRWFPKGYLWYGLQSAICVIRTSMRQRHQSEFPTQEVHYYLSSLKPDARDLAARIRAHWEVENRCHHLLDVTFHEDLSPVRQRTAAHNLSLLREISAKLLKDHPGKGSLKAKRKEAAFSSNFRTEVLSTFLLHNTHA